MIKRFLLAGLILGCYCNLATAQNYNWITGGGSNELMSPSRLYEHVNFMCTDADGNVYITAIVGATDIKADTFFELIAHDSYPSQPHILFASYRCDGTMRFAEILESSDDANSGGLAYGNGSVYLTGSLSSYSFPQQKYISNDTTITSQYLQQFMARFDTLGHFRWIRFVGPDTPSTQILTFTTIQPALAIDGNGDIHSFNTLKQGLLITPTIVTPTPGTYDLKYDSTGNLLSANQIPALDSIWGIVKVVFNKQDNKFFTIVQPNNDYWYPLHASWNSAVCAFRPDETMLWMDQTDSAAGVSGLDYKGGNEVYTGVTCASTVGVCSFAGITFTDTIFPGYQTAALFRLDTNGTAKWVYNLQGNQGIDAVVDVTILPNGNIAATGNAVDTSIHGTDTLTSSSIEPLFVIVDSNGNTVKLDKFYGVGGADAWGWAVTSDAVGNVYAGGELDYSIYAGSLAPYITNGGNTDFYLVKYGYSCICTVAPLSGFTHTGATIVTFTYTGTTGYDSVRWEFGDGSTSTVANPTHTYTTAGSHHVCATVYTACGNSTYCNNIGNTTSIANLSNSDALIYPNPATDMLFIEHAEYGTVIKLFNVLGKQVYMGDINNKGYINTGNLTPGIYLLQLTDNNGNRIVKTIVKD